NWRKAQGGAANDASERDRTDEGGDVAHDMGAAKKISIRSKSGFMLGLGETAAQVDTLMDDLRAVGCEFLTIGQYLAPSRTHHAVVEYVHPDVFDSYAKTARAKGFAFVASAPFVRSSYHAEEALAD
ncbi:MAG: hypothetical protein LBT52_00805, partial [Clostridiales Family XIII bacterium]|nr:hypothetical protein [Clostridiales Family XIII bacterium]